MLFDLLIIIITIYFMPLQLLSQKVGAPRASAAEYYVQRANKVLWEHIRKFRLENVEDGIGKLRNGSLDIMIADTPILDYYRATDHGCKLQKIGDSINQDTYAVGMSKGFPLKVRIFFVRLFLYALKYFFRIAFRPLYPSTPVMATWIFYRRSGTAVCLVLK